MDGRVMQGAHRREGAGRTGFATVRMPLVVAFFLACLLAAACAGCAPAAPSWDMPAPERAEGGYALQLTGEQRAAAASATYTVAKRTPWGYYAIVSGAPAAMDEAGGVTVPDDPTVVAVVVDDGADDMLCAASCETAEGGGLAYTVNGLRLCASANLGKYGFPLGAEPVSAEVRAEGEDGRAATARIVRKQQAYPLGPEVTDEQMKRYRGAYFAWGTGRGMTRGADGSLASLAEWEETDGISGSWVEWSDCMAVQLVPLSQVKSLASKDAEYLVQVVVEDTAGAHHASAFARLPYGGFDRGKGTDESVNEVEELGEPEEAVELEGSNDPDEPEEPDGSDEPEGSAVVEPDSSYASGGQVRLAEVVTDHGAMTFAVADGEAGLASYAGDDDRLKVPAEVEGVPVTTVMAKALENNEYVHEIDLPDSVTYIGSNAFRGSQLKRFAVPKHLEHLGNAAFAHADALAAFEQHGKNGVTSVRDGVLYSADGATLLAYPSAKGAEFDVPDGVRTIGHAAFCGANVTRVGLPESLREIGPCAFAGCNGLKSVELPRGLQAIGSAAFAVSAGFMQTSDTWYAPVKSIRIGPNVSYVGVDAFAGLALHSIEVDERNDTYRGAGGFLASADGVLLQAPAGLTGAVEVPEGIVGLAAGSLDDFGSSTSAGEQGKLHVFLPASLESIEEGALPTTSSSNDMDNSGASVENAVLHVEAGSWAEGYAQDRGLEYDNARDASELAYRQETVAVRKGNLGFRVYADHAELSSIDVAAAGHVQIPDRVSGVPVTAVGVDDSDTASGVVKTLIIPASVERIQGTLLSQVPGVRRFEVAEGNAHYAMREGSIYSADGTVLVAYPRERDETYAVPEGTVEIGPRAFAGCTATSVQLPEGLQVIGELAFASCHDLQQVNFPSTLREVKPQAFWMSGLTSPQLNDGLQTIARDAFANMEGYEGLAVPDSVTAIGDGALRSADGLMSIGQRTLAIGAGLERIGDNNFVGLDIDGFAVAAGNTSFRADGPFLLSADGRALVACAGAASGEVRVPEGVESIGGGVFDGVPGVTDVYLPDSVLRISSVAVGTDRLDGGANPITFHVAAGSEAAYFAQIEGLHWVEE